MKDSDSSDEGSGAQGPVSADGPELQNIIASVGRDGNFLVHASTDQTGHTDYRMAQQSTGDSEDSDADTDGLGGLARVEPENDSARGERSDGWVVADQTVPESCPPKRRGLLRAMISCLLCRSPMSRSSVRMTRANATPEPIRVEKINPRIEEPVPQYVLPPLSPADRKTKLKTLILDLDETLVHSSFKPVPNADFIVPVEIEGVIHQVYVCKRPGVDRFLAEVGPYYEVVVFTASLQKYADPVVDLLDKTRVVKGRLFRGDCVNHYGNFVKDLSVLGRDLDKTIIIDNAATSYIFHPENALPCVSWFDDPTDTELLEFIPLLQELSKVEDVRVGLEPIVQERGVSNMPQYSE